MSKNSGHISILVEEILSFVPPRASGFLLDVTAGGGGHFFAILKRHQNWTGECWDQDPDACTRIVERARAEGVSNSYRFVAKNFGSGPESGSFYDFILADLGISSFQIDDPARGLSLFSQAPIDFRMNPSAGLPFADWLRTQSVFDLERIFEVYGEEPKAKKLADFLHRFALTSRTTARDLAEAFRKVLNYSDSRAHPATRAFQALRIAINDELGELESLLEWAPRALRPGGRLAILSFHSLEDRRVKKTYHDLADHGGFDILTSKPRTPSREEQAANSRSRSAKLRVLAKKG